MTFTAGAATAVLAVATVAQAAPHTVSDVPQKMPTFNGGVYASVYVGNTLYVGGAFTSVNWGGKKLTRTRLAAINATTGALLDWAPSADATVLALAADPATSTVYAGGDFATVNGTTRGGLAAINATTGVLGAFNHTVSGEPRALAVGHDRLYLGGHITGVDSKTRSNLAAFSLSSGALDTGWVPTADNNVYSLLSDTNRVYIGGKFRKINGISGTAKLAAVSPDTAVRDATFKPVLQILVYDIALGPNGIFASEGGQGGRAIAYSSTGKVQWTFTTDGDIRAVAYLDGVVYSGGHFDHACKSASTGLHGVCLDGSSSRIKFAAVDASTGTLLPWNPEGNGIHGVFTLAVNPALGTVAAGGEFTTLQGVSHGRFAQFH